MKQATWDAFETIGHTKNGLLLRSKWAIDYDTPYGMVTVPKHTKTDGASIPKMFWSILGPHGEYFLAAFLHDYAYSKAGQDKLGWDRYMADMALDHAMKKTGVSFLKRALIISGVRLGGWKAYSDNRKKVDTF